MCDKEWFQPKSLDDLSIGEMYFIAENNRVQGLGEFDGYEISTEAALYVFDEADFFPQVWLQHFEWPAFDKNLITKNST